MPHAYSTITVEQQLSMLDSRLAQFEAEHFNHEMNKVALATTPDSTEKTAALDAANAAQTTIEAAIAAIAAQKAHLTTTTTA